MFEYNYYPVLLDLGFFKIYTWGFIVALGFLISIILAKKYSGIKDNHVYNIGLLAVIGGIVGGRLGYFLYYPSEFGFFNMLKVWDGGMSIFGGLVLSLLFIIIYLIANKIKILRTLDKLIIFGVIGFIIGRIGCVFGDGGHLGKQTNLFFGFVYEGVGRHLTALYEIIFFLALFFVLFWLRKKYSFKIGLQFSVFLIFYGLFRFFIDFLRADILYYGLTVAQYLSIISFVIGLIIFRRSMK